MKLKEVYKSRTLTFNTVIGAAIPLFNHFFPSIAITAELANQVLVLGNIALRFLTDSPVGKNNEQTG